MVAYLSVNVSELHWAGSSGPIVHLMAVNHYVHKTSMKKLTESGRYCRLSLTYARYLPLLGEGLLTTGDLAQRLDISKQACSKTLKDLEKAGLVKRRKNPADARSSLLSLTRAGQELHADGVAVTTEIEQQLAGLVGAPALNRLVDALETVSRALAIDLSVYAPGADADNLDAAPATRLNVLLPALSDYFYLSLVKMLGEKGFEGLKPAYSQVLGLLDLAGGRIQTMASMIGISKQAVAALSAELTELGYLIREPDPLDKRQVILRLSPKGEALHEAGLAGVNALAADLQDILGEQDYRHLEATSAALYAHLVGEDDTQVAAKERIQQLSQSLVAELGAAGARSLANQLLAITRGEP